MNHKIVNTIILVSFFLFGCKNQSNEVFSTKEQSLFKVMRSETACDSFLLALEQFEHYKKLLTSEDSTSTVVVPSNEAFRTYLYLNSYVKISEIPQDTLVKLLGHCFIKGNTLFGKLTSNAYLKTLESKVYEEGYFLKRDNSVLFLYHSNDSVPVKLLTSDVVCNNGILNRSDKIVLPNTVKSTKTTEEVLVENKLDSLKKLINLVPRLANLLKSDSSITIFAPTNESFTSYLNGKSMSSLSSTTLLQLGEYHFINNQLYKNQLYKNLSITTLNKTANNRLTIKRNGSVTTFLSTSSTLSLGTIITADIKSNHAIVQIISTVLVPK